MVKLSVFFTFGIFVHIAAYKHVGEINPLLKLTLGSSNFIYIYFISIFFQVGEHDVTIEGDGEVIVGVKRIIQHPDYHTTQYTNDLSLLNLKKPLLPSSTIGYICMPVGITNKNSGLPMEISGWGAVQEKGMNSPGVNYIIILL